MPIRILPGFWTRLLLVLCLPVNALDAAEAPEILISSNSPGPGDELVVKIADVANANAWMSFVASDTPDYSYAGGVWTYLSSLEAGTWTVKVPDAPGDYEVRVYTAGGYTVDARVPISVGSNAAAAQTKPADATQATPVLEKAELKTFGDRAIALKPGMWKGPAQCGESPLFITLSSDIHPYVGSSIKAGADSITRRTKVGR